VPTQNELNDEAMKQFLANDDKAATKLTEKTQTAITNSSNAASQPAASAPSNYKTQGPKVS